MLKEEILEAVIKFVLSVPATNAPPERVVALDTLNVLLNTAVLA
jgi:hypothetical protein